MATWQDYLTQARRFWDVAQAVDAPGYHSQAVSNAVLAVIAANDALCLFRIGERARSDSHAEAITALKKACQGIALERQVAQRVRQLTDVLQQKSPSQYYGQQVHPDTTQRVMTQARRFIEWVEEILPELDPGNPEAGD